MAFEIHINEKETYEIDFAQNRLAAGETLATADEAKVRKRTTIGWDDVTPDFGALGEAVADNTKVQFTLEPAAAVLAGVYQVLIKATTSTGRQIVATASLTVSVRAAA